MEQKEAINELGTVSCEGKGGKIQCVSIIGQIEGHYSLDQNQKTTKYEHIIPLLVAIEESDEIDGVIFIFNTMGGDVEAGLAIAEMISSMKKPTVSLVIGGSHSIGVPLAVSAKKSFIVKSATMTIHPVRINGLVIGADQTYRYLNDMQDRIINFICEHSKVKEEKIRELMTKPDEIANDIGTIIDGSEAVEIGLIERIGGLDEALSTLRKMIKGKKK